MRRRWIFSLALLLILAASLLLILRHQPDELSLQPSDEQYTLDSFRKVDDFPLYVMTYHGDYGFDDYLLQGLSMHESSPLPLVPAWACTTFSTVNAEGDFIFGRNFDWHDHPTLLLFTDPPHAYASATMVDLNYLGFLKDQEPSPEALSELLNAPYWPFDGMNEYGLAVSIMAVPSADPGLDPQKVTISSLEAIRLMLDYARDVDEAVALLEDYNIDFIGGPPLHYLIADGEGDSVIVEFIEGETVLLRSEEPWQVSTNFLFSEEKPEGSNSSCWRYNRAYDRLRDVQGNLSSEEAMQLLGQVSQSGDYPTIWSVVYNQTSGEIFVVVGRDYDNTHPFRLEMAK
jgi:hypothetical protein